MPTGTLGSFFPLSLKGNVPLLSFSQFLFCLSNSYISILGGRNGQCNVDILFAHPHTAIQNNLGIQTTVHPLLN